MPSTTPGSGADRRQRPSLRKQEAKTAYVLIGAAFIIIVVLVLYPAVQSIIQSFRRDNLTNPAHDFTGLKNYTDTFADPAFVQAALNTAGYLAVALVLSLVMGLLMALWLQSLRGLWRGMAVTIVMLPWAVPGTVAGSLWSFILNPTGSGLLNSTLKALNLVDDYQVWIAKPFWGIVLIALSFCWGLIPLGAIIMLAGLEAIPEDYYEQSYMDGASAYQRFFNITIPLLRPSIAIVLVNAAVSSIGIYDQVYVLAGNDPTKISVIGQTYLYAFRDFNFGLGFAASVLTTIATVLIAGAFLKFVYREEIQ